MAWLPLLANADIRIENGTAPTGRYSIRITSLQENDPHGYEVWFYDEKADKRIAKTNVQCFYATAQNAAETMKVAWHRSGEFVAFNHRDSKHSMELFVYSLVDGKPSRLPILNYEQNALGRVNAVEVALHSVSTPKPWNNDTLMIDYYFSVDHEDKGRFFYNAEIELQLHRELNNTPRIQLLSVSQPINDH
jgi:hypothetical protein